MVLEAKEASRRDFFLAVKSGTVRDRVASPGRGLDKRGWPPVSMRVFASWADTGKGLDAEGLAEKSCGMVCAVLAHPAAESPGRFPILFHHMGPRFLMAMVPTNPGESAPSPLDSWCVGEGFSCVRA
jgi:hypothetical protein